MTPAETIEAAKLMQEWAESVLDGKPIEIECKNKCAPNASWLDCDTPVWNWQLAHYHRKPQPKRVPLGPEDVPPGSVFRHESLTTGWEAVTRVHMHGLIIGYDLRLEWSQLDKWKISRDNGKTWEGCWKEVRE